MTTQPKPTFYIVTPSYNQAEFLRTTIESVVYQDGPFDLVYFIADGGSKDGSVPLIGEYAHHLEYCSEADRGQTHAINKGIDFFEQRYAPQPNDLFAYLNSDDYYLPGALATIAEAAAADKGAAWFVGDARIVDARDKRIQEPVRRYKRIWRTLYSTALLHILNPIPQPSTFLRWSTVQAIGGFNESLQYVMDYEYWLRVQKNFGSPLFLDETLSAFRIHGQSKGGIDFGKQFTEQYRVAAQNGAYLPERILQRGHNTLIRLVYSIAKRNLL